MWRHLQYKKRYKTTGLVDFGFVLYALSEHLSKEGDYGGLGSRWVQSTLLSLLLRLRLIATSLVILSHGSIEIPRFLLCPAFVLYNLRRHLVDEFSSNSEKRREPNGPRLSV